jgi:predicted sugar kinase
MGVFPALVERDFASFSTHIATIQTLIGEYFGPSQGGQFASSRVAQAIAWVKETHAVSGVGQTSWGPTGFAFVESAARAQQITDELSERFAGTADLSFSVHRGRNRGATVERTEQMKSPTVATG